MICAWIDTSSADTGSSPTISSGLKRQRAGDADALALAAGEFVREGVDQFRAQPDPLEQMRHPLAALLRRADPWMISGSPTISPADMRGLSEAYGSW